MADHKRWWHKRLFHVGYDRDGVSHLVVGDVARWWDWAAEVSARTLLRHGITYSLGNWVCVKAMEREREVAVLPASADLLRAVCPWWSDDD